MVLAAYWGLLVKIVHCISDSYKTELKKEKDKSCDSSSLVEHHIEISNRFLHDLEATIDIAKQCKAEPCHKPPLSKGGLEGL